MGNVTVALLKRGVTGNARWADVTVTFSGSYATGGDSTAAADWVTMLGHGYGTTAAAGATAVNLIQSEVDTSGNMLSLDRATGKFLLFDIDSQAAGGFNGSAVAIRARLHYDNPTS